MKDGHTQGGKGIKSAIYVAKHTDKAEPSRREGHFFSTPGRDLVRTLGGKRCHLFPKEVAPFYKRGGTSFCSGSEGGRPALRKRHGQDALPGYMRLPPYRVSGARLELKRLKVFSSTTWVNNGGKCMKSPLIFLLLQTRIRRKEDGFSPWIRRLRTEIPAGTGGDICRHGRGYRCGRPSTRPHNQQAYRQLRKRHHPSDFNHTAL